MTEQSRNNLAVLIIGASSAIGQAMIEKYQSNLQISTIISISQCAINYANTDKISHFVSDYSERSVCDIIDELNDWQGKISEVIICNGQLHSNNIQPEKRLEDIDFAAMAALFEINTLVPLRWIKHLLTLCQGTAPCKIVCLSARVGSIGDNQLGGWYSYRASKAALNMALKTAAVEYQRRAKNIKLIAFHPGTTDTPLSKPFQKKR